MQVFLGYASVLLGFISLFWIALRSEYRSLKPRLGLRPRVTRDWGVYLIPYILGVLGLIALAWAIVYPEPKLEYHSIGALSTKDSTVALNGQDEVEVFSSEEHFRVTIRGGFYGPELSGFLADYEEPIRIYAVVSETRLETRELWFLQKNEGGILGPDGGYEITAFLGGTGGRRANDRERFYIRVYIPRDSDVRFVDNGVYSAGPEAIPEAAFLSNPVSVITRR